MDDHGISSKHWQKSTDYIWINRRNTEHWMLSSCPINNKTIKLIIKFLLNWDLVDFIGWRSVWKYGVCFFSSFFFLMCCIQSIWNLPCRFLPYCLREKAGKKIHLSRWEQTLKASCSFISLIYPGQELIYIQWRQHLMRGNRSKWQV